MRYSATMLDISRIRAISIDLDDTLWPILPIIQRAEGALRQWLGKHAPHTALLLSQDGAMLRIRQSVVADFGKLDPAKLHDFAALRQESLRRALREAGEDSGLAAPAFEAFHDERQRVELYDDALHCLRFLSARFPLVALSNGTADVQRIGIGAYFHAALSARELGLGKPDPRAFEAAAERANALPAQVLHIGDDKELDTLGALRAGMQAVWLNRGAQDWTHEDRPHATVTDLHQLCDLFTGKP
jgi:FMN hydrolase / 5-amino-6-(5-phospho-D-ribitylamino)uracil phosphatase